MLLCDRILIRQGTFRLTADWSLQAGERVAVIGPSGAGKSTLLMGIAGFAPVEQGRILWQGADMTVLPPGTRPVSVLFQDQNLFPHLTVIENLALGLTPDLRRGLKERERLDEALRRVGLAGLDARRPAELSGGQQGRAALARALLRERPILLLDEPFAALDPALKADMLVLVKKIAAETRALVMMVTHDPADARRFAERIILVDRGEAQTPVATEALFANPPPALRDYLGQA